LRLVKKTYNFISDFISTQGRRLKNELITELLTLKAALAEESSETKSMLATYAKYTSGEVSRIEMNKANEQFRDLIRALGIGIFAFLPLAPITIPLIVKIGRKVGVDILPSAFRRKE